MSAARKSPPRKPKDRTLQPIFTRLDPLDMIDRVGALFKRRKISVDEQDFIWLALSTVCWRIMEINKVPCDPTIFYVDMEKLFNPPKKPKKKKL